VPIVKDGNQGGQYHESDPYLDHRVVDGAKAPPSFKPAGIAEEPLRMLV